MPSDQAEKSSKAGRPRLWVAGLLVFLLVAGLVGFLASRPEVAELPGPGGGPPTSTATRADAASRLLSDLTEALRRGDRDRLVGLADGDAARSELDDLLHNVEAMGITGLSMRYVDEAGRAVDAPASDGEVWSADVQLTWRIAGFDRDLSRHEVQLRLSRTSEGAAFVSARDPSGEGTTPLWLLTRLRVDEQDGAMVVAAPGRPIGPLAEMARAAVRDVRAVLPRWRAGLVVEVPGTQPMLGATLGSGEETYDSIAAVTTTVDGSLSPPAPVHVFVNPAVFDPLGPNGAQIVISHEATHVALDAATSTMPTWLLEGFADFVALDRVDLPVSVTASQILGTVRTQGPPDKLPGAEEFDPAEKTLGASYEAAWLACRLLGETYGVDRLLAFYRASDREGSTTAAFRRVLGTTEAAFTRDWQDYLRSLA